MQTQPSGNLEHKQISSITATFFFFIINTQTVNFYGLNEATRKNSLALDIFTKQVKHYSDKLRYFKSKIYEQNF